MIPRTIHRIWLGSPEPTWSADLGRQWQAMNPQWTVRLWTEESLRAAVNPVCADLLAVLDKPVHRADVWRVELVHALGGVYVDADMEPVRPIEDFVSAHEATSALPFCTPDADGFPGGAFFGASPSSVAMLKLLLSFPKRFRLYPHEGPHIIFGPHCWGAVFEDSRLIAVIGDVETAYPFHYTERHLIHNAAERERRCREALMVHLFHGSWFAPEAERHFEQVVCINLPSRGDRLHRFLDRSRDVGLVAQIRPGLVIPPEEIPSSWTGAWGAWGCLQAHLAIYREAITAGWESVLVLEDDVYFGTDFNQRLNAAMRRLPSNWGMLYLGANHVLPPPPFRGDVHRVAKAFTTHAYAVHQRALPALLATLEKATDAIDVALETFQQRSDCYAIVPSIAFQEAGLSDILGFDVDYSDQIR